MKRRELVRILELTQPAIAGNGLVPVFGCFMFKKGAIIAFNGDTLAIEANFGNEMAFATEGKVLLGLLQNCGAETVSMTVDKCDVSIRAGKTKAVVPYIPEDEFLWDEPESEWLCSCDCTSELFKGIEVCLTTTSRNNAMPAIMGITFIVNGNKTILYSTDGDAITRYSGVRGKGSGSFTVPNAFCEALLKIWIETEAVSGKLEFSGDWAKATLNTGFTIYGRVTTAPLDHEAEIHNVLDKDAKFVSLPEGLSEALARARVLADDESKPTLFTVYNGKLDLLTESKLGEAREELIMKGHPDIEAMVHAELVERSINECNEMVILENCTAYKLGETVLQIVANTGE
jgi:DNA polymerase III sliding clamp (beta) subunit (PCNA family)